MTYTTETGKGKVEKEALLTDSDSLWAEFRHEHIGKVLTDLGKPATGLPSLPVMWHTTGQLLIEQS